jgi:hypothetical protein
MEKRLVWQFWLLSHDESTGLFVGNAIDTRWPVAISGNLHSAKFNCSNIGGRHCARPVFQDRL